MRISFHYIFILLFFFGTTHAQITPETFFEQGNAHYAEGRFQEAIDSYKKVLDAKKESASLYFNLANANYKLNNIAPTVYYYEKALRLSPSDADIKNNAAFAENMKIDAIQSLPENTFQKWFNSVLSLLTTDGWAYATVGFVFLFVLLFVAYYLAKSSGRKRTFFITSFASLILGICSLIFAYSAFAKAEKDRPAIVFAVEAIVKSEPNLASVEAFKLHEGTKVMVLEELDSWKRISLADGKTGWIETTDIKEL